MLPSLVFGFTSSEPYRHLPAGWGVRVGRSERTQLLAITKLSVTEIHGK